MKKLRLGVGKQLAQAHGAGVLIMVLFSFCRTPPWARQHSKNVPGVLATARILGAQGLVIHSFSALSGSLTTGKISHHF